MLIYCWLLTMIRKAQVTHFELGIVLNTCTIRALGKLMLEDGDEFKGSLDYIWLNISLWGEVSNSYIYMKLTDFYISKLNTTFDQMLLLFWHSVSLVSFLLYTKCVSSKEKITTIPTNPKLSVPYSLRAQCKIQHWVP